MLHEKGSRGRSADRGLGMKNLREESKALTFQLRADNGRAKLEASQAHLLRMQASDDDVVARADLDRVESIDKQLAGIKEQAVTTRKGFGVASKTILASSQASTQLQEDAGKASREAKDLRAKISKLVSESHADTIQAAEVKDKMDMVRESLSSNLVRRNRRQKRVQEERGSLNRLQLKYQAADAKAALELKLKQAEYTSAEQDVRTLENKFASKKGKVMHKASFKHEMHQLKNPLVRNTRNVNTFAHAHSRVMHKAAFKHAMHAKHPQHAFAATKAIHKPARPARPARPAFKKHD